MLKSFFTLLLALFALAQEPQLFPDAPVDLAQDSQPNRVTQQSVGDTTSASRSVQSVENSNVTKSIIGDEKQSLRNIKSTKSDPALSVLDATQATYKSQDTQKQPGSIQEAGLFTPEPIAIDSKKEHIDEDETPLPKFAQHPKNLYLNLIDFPTRTLYQREIIAISYRLLVLSNLESLKNELVGGDGSVKPLNIDSIWKKEIDGSFSNTFYFKIEAQNFTIPKIRVNAIIDGKQESDESEGRSGKAIALDRNTLFSKVIAKDLRLTDYKITSYDPENNLAVFRIEAENSNLDDFSLSHYQKYGIESSSITPRFSSIIYYVVAPKSDENIEFDYFSTLDYQYRRITLPNIAIDDKVSTQSDIKPKNTLRIFELMSVAFVALIFIALYLYYRNVVLLVIAFAFIGYALYTLSAKDEGSLKPNAEVRILPTYNSTVILRSSEPLHIEILSEHGGYLKIISEDKKIGWVKKEEVEKD